VDGPAELSELVMRFARLQRRRWREVLAPWDLSPHHARALKVVCERDHVRLSDLAETLHIAPRSATEVADGLQERGLVERAPDPGDRRAVLLRPTDEGRRIRAEVDDARTADSAELFGRLSEAERQALGRLLRALVDEPGKNDA
jgi:DNA-binding MarR family transcriptional regulator